eukprot:CAMPEP_0206432636 /NCGR_PEP_ID=MMETSP0324_2-20121206/8075_1 /ASSEMBLY_ACC=CAM_ASM_000836 /TAXON_ID=2866 /ORGANISM="Crypthecodinium cohnii, Strain Seligo" /LENGTH=497 /DNA_ID=CAMNT_0053898787 /DNA_START=178 /DNA_END=1671 /DNA_ORIENTATION=+
MKYLPNEAREEAERVIKSAQSEAEKHKSAAWQAYLAQGAAEAKATQVERELKLQMATAAEIHAGQLKEQDDRHRSLEKVLESERAAVKIEREQHEKQLDFVRDQFDLKLESEKKKHAQLLAMADARAVAAEEGAKEAKRRADEDIATIRSQAEHRVMEVRKTCEERISKLENSHLEAINELRVQVAAERKSMEEEIRMYREHAREALEEARLRAEENEKNLRIWRSTQEVQFAKKEGDWRDWSMMQRQHQEDFERHHRKLLELEKIAHGRTVSRTAERLVKSLKYGEAVANGLENGPLLEKLTDVQDVHEAAGLGAHPSSDIPALPAPTESKAIQDEISVSAAALGEGEEGGKEGGVVTEEEGGGGEAATVAAAAASTSPPPEVETQQQKEDRPTAPAAEPEVQTAAEATEATTAEAAAEATAEAAATTTTTTAAEAAKAPPNAEKEPTPSSPTALVPKKPSTAKPSLEEEAAFFRKHYRPSDPPSTSDASPSGEMR